MFEIRGKIDGTVYKLKYYRSYEDDVPDDDYIISGDDVAVEKLFAESKIDHGRLGLIPGACWFSEGYLKHETAAYDLAYSYVFDEVVDAKNDWKFDPDVVY